MPHDMDAPSSLLRFSMTSPGSCQVWYYDDGDYCETGKGATGIDGDTKVSGACRALGVS